MKNKLLKIISLPTILASSIAISTSCQNKNSEYTISFDLMDGSEKKLVKTTDGKITEPEIPTREGYAFIGWFKDEKFEYRFNFTEKVTKDTCLYAKWVKNIIVDKGEWDIAFNKITKHGVDHNFKVIYHWRSSPITKVIPIWVQGTTFKAIDTGTEYYYQYYEDGNCNYLARAIGYGKICVESIGSIHEPTNTGLSNYLHRVFQLQNCFDNAVFNEKEQCYETYMGAETNIFKIYFNEDKTIARIANKLDYWEFEDYGGVVITNWPKTNNVFVANRVPTEYALRSEPLMESYISSLRFYSFNMSKLTTTYTTDQLEIKYWGKVPSTQAYEQIDISDESSKPYIALFMNGVDITDKISIATGGTITIDSSVSINNTDKLLLCVPASAHQEQYVELIKNS